MGLVGLCTPSHSLIRPVPRQCRCFTLQDSILEIRLRDPSRRGWVKIGSTLQGHLILHLTARQLLPTGAWNSATSTELKSPLTVGTHLITDLLHRRAHGNISQTWLVQAKGWAYWSGIAQSSCLSSLIYPRAFHPHHSNIHLRRHATRACRKRKSSPTDKAAARQARPDFNACAKTLRYSTRHGRREQTTRAQSSRAMLSADKILPSCRCSSVSSDGSNMNLWGRGRRTGGALRKGHPYLGVRVKRFPAAEARRSATKLLHGATDFPVK